MTQNFKDMLHLFSCGALGLAPDFDHAIDLPGIYKLSSQQGIWCTVFLAIQKLYERENLTADDQYQFCRNLFFKQIAKTTKRREFMKQVIREFSDHQIQYCILKGETLAALYYSPICRISTDTDIFVKQEDSARADGLLKHIGFQKEVSADTSHHEVYTHPVGGIVELHQELFDEVHTDLWFNEKVTLTEQFQTVQIEQEFTIPALGMTDGLIFTALHAIQHFLFAGTGIKQVMDMLLYLRCYKDRIDLDRFQELMSYLKYERFIDYCIEIGTRYLGFSEHDFVRLTEEKTEESVLNEMLTDIETGGMFGQLEMERTGFSRVYNKERFSRFKNENYSKYMAQHHNVSFFKEIFPDKAVLYRDFPYSQRRPVLLPVAWFHRLGRFLISMRQKKRNVRQYMPFMDAEKGNEVTQRRMNLIRKLDMI